MVRMGDCAKFLGSRMMRALALLLPMPMLLLSACATPTTGTLVPPVSLSEVGEARAGTGIAKGYLTPDRYPDSLALLPPPPADGSARMAADREAFDAAVAATEPGRWAQAGADAVLVFPHSVKSYGDVLGIEIGTATTPHLAMLLQRSMADAGLGTYKAKTHYNRTRPFVVANSPTCSPQDEDALRKDGSYPSGHSSIGWTWALILAEVAPDRKDALLQRGFEFGQSRVVCRVHWQSDVEAGRLMASAVMSQLQTDATFRAQLERARAEVAAARAR